MTSAFPSSHSPFSCRCLSEMQNPFICKCKTRIPVSTTTPSNYAKSSDQSTHSPVRKGSVNISKLPEPRVPHSEHSSSPSSALRLPPRGQPGSTWGHLPGARRCPWSRGPPGWSRTRGGLGAPGAPAPREVTAGRRPGLSQWSRPGRGGGDAGNPHEQGIGTNTGARTPGSPPFRGKRVPTRRPGGTAHLQTPAAEPPDPHLDVPDGKKLTAFQGSLLSNLYL